MAHTFTLTNRQQASVSRKRDFGKANVELKPFLQSEYPRCIGFLFSMWPGGVLAIKRLRAA
jgi:hypothetical protein